MSGNKLFLLPETCFEIAFDLHSYKGAFEDEHALPALNQVFAEGYKQHRKEFSWFGAWSEKALFFRCEMALDSFEAMTENGASQDVIELFIDTKNLKSIKTTHRYLHHFSFFPERVEGAVGKELTKFRTEDRHPLCDPKFLETKVVRKKKTVFFDMEIPAKCLVGYVGEEGSLLGFNYRCHEGHKEVMFFGSLPPMQAPYTWPTMRLVK